jgi:hypothetical protein
VAIAATIATEIQSVESLAQGLESEVDMLDILRIGSTDIFKLPRFGTASQYF